MRIRPRTFVSIIVMLVLFVDFPDRLAAEREAGVVDEDVEAAELGVCPLDESLAARRVGDVEIEREEPFAIREAVDPPRADSDSCSRLRQRVRGRSPDPARGARDDSGLSFERGQDARSLTRGTT